MEWLLAHVDDLDASQSQSVPTADGSAATPVEAAAESNEPSAAADAATSDAADGDAKSFKCNDWLVYHNVSYFQEIYIFI